MKYAVNYSRDFRHYDEVDEVILKMRQKQQDFVPFVLALIENNPTLKITLNLTKVFPEEDYADIIPGILKLKKDNVNIVVKVPEITYNVNDFYMAGIPFFYSRTVTRLEEAYIQAELGASEIYIVGELGFRLKDLQALKDIYGVEFRVYPNIAQSINKNMINGVTRFWIRPEDTEIYEPYVDTFELLGGMNELRSSTIYEIYKQQQWMGNLNDIILDFDSPVVNNRGMNPHFAEVRLNCGKKCLLGKCNLCEQMATLANNFVEVGIEAIKPRKKKERSEEEKEAIRKKLAERADEFRFNKETV